MRLLALGSSAITIVVGCVIGLTLLRRAARTRGLPELAVGLGLFCFYALSRGLSMASAGLGDSIGSLAAGKRADLIQVAFDDVHHVPTYDVISHLVYVTDEQDVAAVVVDGRVLMRDGEFLTIDTERVAAEARALAAQIQAALTERNR